ncbi:PTS system cellobiose-specific IIB component [Streptohalobacillus salinus]|uniref:PTS system cellobiose-specific IIB component n=1 Tax=Streptohalobacillus salinus TaxID=621096 RepID=A0A2V3W1S4_9BACI|nr:PTS sugar transporter subunit IIB [Streptohalobacillus salinus]PXW88283.1 PTS system cellobiose-specific IIB component [Streptohalobacillus salinus]
MSKVNIILVCSAGMSTSLLVERMKLEADKRALDASIEAMAESELKNHLDQLDVVLIGPQVRYLEKQVKKLVEPKGINAAVIDTMAYGRIQGDVVLDQALALI